MQPISNTKENLRYTHPIANTTLPFSLILLHLRLYKDTEIYKRRGMSYLSSMLNTNCMLKVHKECLSQSCTIFLNPSLFEMDLRQIFNRNLQSFLTHFQKTCEQNKKSSSGPLFLVQHSRKTEAVVWFVV